MFLLITLLLLINTPILTHAQQNDGPNPMLPALTFALLPTPTQSYDFINTDLLATHTCVGSRWCDLKVEIAVAINRTAISQYLSFAQPGVQFDPIQHTPTVFSILDDTNHFGLSPYDQIPCINDVEGGVVYGAVVYQNNTLVFKYLPTTTEYGTFFNPTIEMLQISHTCHLSITPPQDVVKKWSITEYAVLSGDLSIYYVIPGIGHVLSPYPPLALPQITPSTLFNMPLNQVLTENEQNFQFKKMQLSPMTAYLTPSQLQQLQHLHATMPNKVILPSISTVPYVPIKVKTQDICNLRASTGPAETTGWCGD